LSFVKVSLYLTTNGLGIYTMMLAIDKKMQASNKQKRIALSSVNMLADWDNEKRCDEDLLGYFHYSMEWEDFLEPKP
jgi:hypothetical protein